MPCQLILKPHALRSEVDCLQKAAAVNAERRLLRDRLESPFGPAMKFQLEFPIKLHHDVRVITEFGAALADPEP